MGKTFCQFSMSSFKSFLFLAMQAQGTVKHQRSPRSPPQHRTLAHQEVMTSLAQILSPTPSLRMNCCSMQPLEMASSPCRHNQSRQRTNAGAQSVTQLISRRTRRRVGALAMLHRVGAWTLRVSCSHKVGANVPCKCPCKCTPL